MPEIRQIPGFTEYGASGDGRIWRVSRPKNGKIGVAYPREMRLKQTNSGYLSVAFGKDRRRYSVHRLIALAFHGVPTDDLLEVAHSDGDKTNNAATNLRWATRLENARDRIKHGTQARGAAINTAVLSKGDVEWIHAYPKVRGAVSQMAARLQVNPETIGRILRGQSWSHLCP